MEGNHGRPPVSLDVVLVSRDGTPPLSRFGRSFSDTFCGEKTPLTGTNMGPGTFFKSRTFVQGCFTTFHDFSRSPMDETHAGLVRCDTCSRRNAEAQAGRSQTDVEVRKVVPALSILELERLFENMKARLSIFADIG